MRLLGAGETIDWTSSNLATEVRNRHENGIDGLIDLVNDDPVRFADLALGVLGDAGRGVSTLRAADPSRAGGRAVANVFAAPDRAQLDRVAILAQRGVLRARISEAYELGEIDDALTSVSEGRVGKIAIRVARDDGTR